MKTSDSIISFSVVVILQGGAEKKIQKIRKYQKSFLKANSENFFLFLSTNCAPSLEPSQRDGSNGGQNIGLYGEI